MKISHPVRVATGIGEIVALLAPILNPVSLLMGTIFLELLSQPFLNTQLTDLSCRRSVPKLRRRSGLPPVVVQEASEPRFSDDLPCPVVSEKSVPTEVAETERVRTD